MILKACQRFCEHHVTVLVTKAPSDFCERTEEVTITDYGNDQNGHRCIFVGLKDVLERLSAPDDFGVLTEKAAEHLALKWYEKRLKEIGIQK